MINDYIRELMLCMEVSEIRIFTLNLSNYFPLLIMVCIGETQLDDMGYFDLCNGVSVMPKLEDVKLNFAHIKKLKLKELLKK